MSEAECGVANGINVIAVVRKRLSCGVTLAISSARHAEAVL
ncbi:MAG TPA: hypothetical protein VJL10_08865 [Anaerolineales bacterium]|nr:hypothetical protein [Anaerolineales bacterium]